MTKKATKKKGLLVLEGAVAGAILGVAAGLLAGSGAGKKLGKKVKSTSADFYRYVAPQVKKAKKMGEAEYKAFMDEAVKRYNKDRHLSEAEVKKLSQEAKASWKHLKKAL